MRFNLLDFVRDASRFVTVFPSQILHFSSHFICFQCFHFSDVWLVFPCTSYSTTERAPSCMRSPFHIILLQDSVILDHTASLGYTINLYIHYINCYGTIIQLQNKSDVSKVSMIRICCRYIICNSLINQHIFLCFASCNITTQRIVVKMHETYIHYNRLQGILYCLFRVLM